VHRFRARLEQVHRQNHRILVGLRLDRLDGAVGAHPVKIGEAEGVFPVLRQGEKIAVQAAQVLNQEGLAVARLAHQDKGHLLGGAALGGVLDVRDELLISSYMPMMCFLPSRKMVKSKVVLPLTVTLLISFSRIIRLTLWKAFSKTRSPFLTAAMWCWSEVFLGSVIMRLLGGKGGGVCGGTP
jgi:hypothetical protein